jgi:hypothetical protein
MSVGAGSNLAARSRSSERPESALPRRSDASRRGRAYHPTEPITISLPEGGFGIPDRSFAGQRASRLVRPEGHDRVTGCRAALLLGQSFLKRFGSVEIDNARHVLALGPERADSGGLPQPDYFANIPAPLPPPPPGAVPWNAPPSPPPGYTLDRPAPAAPWFDPTKPYTVIPQGSNVAPAVPIDITKLKLTDVSLAYAWGNAWIIWVTVCFLARRWPCW